MLRAQLGVFGEERHVDALGLFGRFRQIFPDFLGGKDEDRRREAHERAADFPDGGLRGAARFVVGGFGVEPIFQHVVIKRAEIDDAEIVNRVIDAMEFVARNTSRGTF